MLSIVLAILLIHTLQAQQASESGYATHYGYSYAGLPLGCTRQPYNPYDPTILAVGPSRYSEWPCGTQLEVTGPTGLTITVTRQDSCPGCAHNVLDLSEAANELVCGNPPHTCRVTFKLIREGP